MKADAVIHALGARIGLDLGALDPSQRAVVLKTWCAAVGRGQAADVVVTVPAQPDTVRLLARLSQSVTREAIECRRGEGWMLHAAAVADDTGAVVVLVGLSGAGKTTAARVLGREFAYLTDETVFLARDGAVLPYRKPLSVIESRRGPKSERAPETLGLDRPVPERLHVAAIVLLDRRADAEDEASVSVVDLGDALPELVMQSNYLGEMRAPLRTIGHHAQAVGGVRRVRYREASQLVPIVRGLLDRPRTSRPAPRDVGEDDARHASRSRWTSAPRYARRPVDDVLPLTDPDRLAVLAHGSVRVLSGIGPAIWRNAEGAPLSALVQSVVAGVGSPPGASAEEIEDSVRAAVDALVSEGLLSETAPRWRIRADVAWTDDGETITALPLGEWRRAAPFGIEGSGAVIWRELASAVAASADAASPRELAEAVALRLQVDQRVAGEWVTAFLDELGAAGLVEAETAPVAS
ncbi:hypothetical protein [Microbacterium aurantiacum]|uniref:PqqD family peptide modification chaperone n=1 Tax=Microbacterium aurantiacum TaxID=162393 RepID=A0AAJ2LXB2_9MICO|nr:hypothetical protein [Microbacterium aurantiacum]MDS0244198.1 hypothetical protein [Microbacterium aurantiacum]